MTHGKKHGWPFWFAVAVIALPVLYVASFGPACRTALKHNWASEPFFVAYHPLEATLLGLPRPIAGAIVWYANLWMPYGGFFNPPYDNPNGQMSIGVGTGCAPSAGM